MIAVLTRQIKYNNGSEGMPGQNPHSPQHKHRVRLRGAASGLVGVQTENSPELNITES